MRTKDTPRSIAIGVAVGTFITILPTPFLNIPIGLLITLTFRQISRLALFGSIAFWNPLTLAPVYYLSFRIGDVLFDNAPVVNFKLKFLDHAFSYSRRFLVGNIILAACLSLLMAFLSYGIAHWIVYRRSLRKLRSAHQE